MSTSCRRVDADEFTLIAFSSCDSCLLQILWVGKTWRDRQKGRKSYLELFSEKKTRFISSPEIILAHLRDCGRCRAAGPTEGGDVAAELSVDAGVAGLTEDGTCAVVWCVLGITGPPAWDPHTFSTWGRDSLQGSALGSSYKQHFTTFLFWYIPHPSYISGFPID